jgi:hypothetical protein
MLKLPLYNNNKMYVTKFENMMNLLNDMCFLHLMNMLYILQLSFNVCH